MGLKKRMVAARGRTYAFHRWAFLGGGAFLLLMTYAFTAFAHYEVQLKVRSAVMNALHRRDLTWVGVDVSGQEVRLHGRAPSALAAREAIMLAQGAQCETLWGEQPCSGEVIADIEVVMSRAEAEPAPAPSRFDFRFERLPDGILAAGEIPRAVARERIVRAVHDHLGADTRIEDALRVVEGVPHEGWDDVVQRAIVGLSWMSAGYARLEDGELTFRGEVLGRDRPAVEVQLAGLPAAYRAAPLRLVETEEADACDARLARVLARGVHFRAGTAHLLPRDRAVLTRLATSAAACPGVLRIEGHTDNVGDRAANLTLSRDRARAVREALISRGVPGRRLVALGFGDMSPIAANDTAAQRSRNRRVEVRVSRTGSASR